MRDKEGLAALNPERGNVGHRRFGGIRRIFFLANSEISPYLKDLTEELRIIEKLCFTFLISKCRR
jgi:hypothetical protein